MKKMIGILSVICAVVSLTACTGKPAEVTEEGFAPALDTNPRHGGVRITKVSLGKALYRLHGNLLYPLTT